MITKKERWQTELETKRKRLNLYLDMEEKMLTGSPQAYSIGSRSKTNYSMSPDQLRTAIKQLEEEVEELENLLNGNRSRKCVGVVPRF